MYFDFEGSRSFQGGVGKLMNISYATVPEAIRSNTRASYEDFSVLGPVHFLVQHMQQLEFGRAFENGYILVLFVSKAGVLIMSYPRHFPCQSKLISRTTG